VSQPIDRDAERIKEAEGIWNRWQAEEFDLDFEKAWGTSIHVTDTKIVIPTQEVIKSEPRETDVASDFTSCLNHYRASRGTSFWASTAQIFADAYQGARVRGCIVAGSSVKRELQQAEHRIAQLDAENQEWKKKADGFENDFHKANDALLDKDRELADCQKELADIRGQDIKDHLDHGAGHIQSGVEPKEGDKETDE
jgi:hypothetical protein